MLQVAYS